ncbi:MFS transporter [Actinoplanes sp. NBRC 103695]|uniref:MFS transporter n=1 Tax=Actinoplanes sp. NBRC 103695 TaxID=3032202 RepID=UPI0024A4A149|nr:MFS transporter [Actinoplanes sp. NBRC 103695]GLY97138.1 MFS transporter [Actinoplanes sp. NBRC 103695]
MSRFGKYWAGQTVSEFGDRVSELALPLIAVTTLAATPAEVGLLTAAVWTPNLLSILIGSWVDGQSHRRRLLIIGNLISAAAMLSLPLAYWFGVVTLAQLFVVALLAGVGQVVFQAAGPSFFVKLVDRDGYVDANSKLSTTRSASFVAGPALGGFLIQFLTAPVAMLVDAVSFIVSALFISRIEVEPSVPAASSSPRDGLTYVRRHPYLRAALACVTTINFFTFIAQALVVLFASRELGLSAGLIGLAFGLGALGGLLGAVVAPRLSRRYGVGRGVVAGAILFPAPIALLALAGGPTWVTFAVLVAAEAVSMFGVMIFDINLNSVQAAVTADAMRGRMVGVFGTINYGIRPLGAVVGGLLATGIGVRPALLVAAAGGVLACLWLLPSPIPQIRDIKDLALAA